MAAANRGGSRSAPFHISPGRPTAGVFLLATPLRPSPMLELVHEPEGFSYACTRPGLAVSAFHFVGFDPFPHTRGSLQRANRTGKIRYPLLSLSYTPRIPLVCPSYFKYEGHTRGLRGV